MQVVVLAIIIIIVMWILVKRKKNKKKIWMMKSFLLTWNNNTWSINFTVGKSIFGHSSGQDQDKWNFLDFHQALLASPKRKKTRRDVFFY